MMKNATGSSSEMTEMILGSKSRISGDFGGAVVGQQPPLLAKL